MCVLMHIPCNLVSFMSMSFSQFPKCAKENGADGALFLFGVFDGHGRLGHEAMQLF